MIFWVSTRQISNLVSLLKNLRRGEGVTVARLLRSSTDTDELLRAPALAAHRQRSGPVNHQALVSEMVALADELQTRDRAVVLAVLGLEPMLGDDDGSTDRPDLTTRRRLLLSQWSDRVGGQAPSCTSLRTRLEEDALMAFARLLAEGADIDRPVGRAVVIGGAVIDYQYRVADFPDLRDDRAMAAHSLLERPGGKGLTVAVALARLGFEVDLVSVVGQDSEGDNVLDFLELEQVGTTYVDRMPGRTGRVTVLTNQDEGHSFAISWMNREELIFKPELISDAIGSLEVDDNLLFTLEPRIATVRSMLGSLALQRSDRPRVLMIPAPISIDGQILDINAIERVDYVIAHEHELGYYVPQFDTLDERARFLRRGPGVETVVVCDVGHARAYGDFDPVERSNPNTLVRELAGTREAFAAAFLRQMARLDRRGHPAGERIDEALNWAMAAMELSAMQPGVVDGMPDEKKIVQFLNR